jgi:hypothetical protein
VRIRANLFVAVAVVLTALYFPFSNAIAVTCEMLSVNVEDARTKLRRAANESDFEEAKDYAQRAKSALDNAALSAMDCDCSMAYSEFEAAASRARRARDADSPAEFVDSLNMAIHASNAALQALRLCASTAK